MIGLLKLINDSSNFVYLKEIQEHLNKLEKELNEISKILNCLSYDVNKYLDITLKNKSKSIINEKKLEYLENQYDKL
jgi:frataxin-like iron-binding protein CyaY